MAAQICENCKHKKDRCYCSTNSTCKKYEPVEMVTKKTWEEFINNGFLWWINMILHTFGWAIVAEIEDNMVKNVYPARVKFRGFSEEKNAICYREVTNFLKENANDLLDEARESKHCIL